MFRTQISNMLSEIFTNEFSNNFLSDIPTDIFFVIRVVFFPFFPIYLLGIKFRTIIF